MRLWLVTSGEPLPIDGQNPRLLRAGQVAKLAAARGHDVTWWTARFDHRRKTQRVGPSKSEIAPQFELRLLRSPGYARNVSFRRVVDHTALAAEFLRDSREAASPDVILVSYPPMELAAAAVWYGSTRSIPTVVDVRDFWPDIYDLGSPPWVRPATRGVLWPYRWLAETIFRRATAVTGITQEAVDWALAYGGRKCGNWDGVFPLAYSRDDPKPTCDQAADQFWAEFLGNRADLFIVCCFVSGGRVVDLRTVERAAALLHSAGIPVCIVVCGNVDITSSVPSLMSPGWVDAPRITALMRRSKAGLVPYHDRFDFRMSVPNKAIEYLSRGLPVVSSLTGALDRLLTAAQCGITYRAGDADHLTQVLNKLASNTDVRRRMAVNAERVFMERFSADLVYGAFVEHLAAIATEERSSSSTSAQERDFRTPESS